MEAGMWRGQTSLTLPPLSPPSATRSTSFASCTQSIYICPSVGPCTPAQQSARTSSRRLNYAPYLSLPLNHYTTLDKTCKHASTTFTRESNSSQCRTSSINNTTQTRHRQPSTPPSRHRAIPQINPPHRKSTAEQTPKGNQRANCETDNAAETTCR